MAEKRGNNIRTPQGTYTAAKLAARVGVSRDTIVNWADKGLLPYTVQDNGKLTVRVYGIAAVRAARKLKDKPRKPARDNDIAA